MKSEPQPEPPKRLPDSYWDIVARQFRKNKVAVVGLVVVIGLFGVALGADFIANDKPLVMRYQEGVYFPVLKDYSVWVHL
jgi:microcin C transport system permease protein